MDTLSQRYYTHSCCWSKSLKNDKDKDRMEVIKNLTSTPLLAEVKCLLPIPYVVTHRTNPSFSRILECWSQVPCWSSASGKEDKRGVESYKQ